LHCFRELAEGVTQALQQRPRVIDLIAVGDDPEVEVVEVAHHRDVQPDPVDDHGDRIVRLEPRAGEVER
jgi:hypothetical protein